MDTKSKSRRNSSVLYFFFQTIILMVQRLYPMLLVVDPDKFNEVGARGRGGVEGVYPIRRVV
jgi:hypothetical protein